ncbi:MAG: DUF3299 domain-containing protein [Pirellulaceae bacterium]
MASRVLVLFLMAVIAQAGISQETKDKPAKKPPKKTWSSTKVNEITFDDVKFDIEKGGKFKREMLTKSIENLDDKKVRLRGWILPSSVFKQKGIRQFVLVRDNMECCFGPRAALYDCVIVEMVKGKSANFTLGPVAIEGEFSVKEYEYPDGGHYAVYRIKGVSVK